MTRRPALLLGCALLALAPAAHAQDDRRLQNLERQVRELRAIVFQGRDTGQPVIVKPEGPDPQVVALQGRLDQEDQQIRDLTGRLEVATHDLDEGRRANEQLKAQSDAARQALADRVTRLESQAATGAPPPAAAAAPAAADPAAPPAAAPPAGPRPRGADVTAQVQAQDTGRLGGGAAPPPAADPFKDAYARLESGDYPGAQSGFEGYIAANPTGPRTGEARYYLGQSLYVRETYAPAARAYAEALKGWPKAKWAPDATVKLAQSLVQLDRSPSACQALAEFSRRYAATAPAAVKTRAASVRARAQCGAG